MKACAVIDYERFKVQKKDEQARILIRKIKNCQERAGLIVEEMNGLIAQLNALALDNTPQKF